MLVGTALVEDDVAWEGGGGGNVGAWREVEEEKMGVCLPDGRARAGQGHAPLASLRVHSAASSVQTWAGKRSKADRKRKTIRLRPRVERHALFIYPQMDTGG